MTVRTLTTRDEPWMRELLSADPITNVFVTARVDQGVLVFRSTGEVWGYPAEHPRSLLYVGANLVPVATDAQARAAFVERLGDSRTCQSIAGPAAETLDLWHRLSQRWPQSYAQARVVRPSQTVMVIDHPPTIPADPRVRRAGLDVLDSYVEASVAMYTEELDADPLALNPVGYRRHVAHLIEQGDALAIVVNDRVIFKADIGVHSGTVVQVQGVWLTPELRGRGLAPAAMAAVVEHCLRRYRTVCLYVNDFNHAAIATYRRVGFRTHGEFATILY